MSNRSLFTLLFTTCYLLFATYHIAATSPASSNYRLDTFSVGDTGTELSTSTNYQTQAVSDFANPDLSKSPNYQTLGGYSYTQMANTPPSPSLTNPSNYYNKLKLIINTGSNPTDATFAIAISPDNFTTTYYLKPDNTIGSALAASDYRTYSSLGSGAGINILGLASNTTYYVKVKSEHGNFTESPWGPSASATTDIPRLSFDLDAAATDTETASPYIIDFGTLSSGSVNTAASKLWVDFDTNADSGGVVYIVSTYGGVKSNLTSTTINGYTGDISTQAQAFGINTNSYTQSSGGPFIPVTPFDGTGNTVGAVSTLLTPIISSTSPTSSGRFSANLKMIISQLTKASSDYTDTLTLVTAATF